MEDLGGEPLSYDYSKKKASTNISFFSLCFSLLKSMVYLLSDLTITSSERLFDGGLVQFPTFSLNF